MAPGLSQSRRKPAVRRRRDLDQTWSYAFAGLRLVAPRLRGNQYECSGIVVLSKFDVDSFKRCNAGVAAPRPLLVLVPLPSSLLQGHLTRVAAFGYYYCCVHKRGTLLLPFVNPDTHFDRVYTHYVNVFTSPLMFSSHSIFLNSSTTRQPPLQNI